MGFVKLKDLYDKEIRVPASAVKTYENLGFYPVKEITEEVEVNSKDENQGFEETEDDLFARTIVKKPLASWSKDEVKRYAIINGIDLSGTKSANDAKERIKEFLKAE